MVKINDKNMARYKITVYVDEETLIKEASFRNGNEEDDEIMDSIDLIEQEMGWVEQSGIFLENIEKIEE
jgi:hypothetical protein